MLSNNKAIKKCFLFFFFLMAYGTCKFMASSTQASQEEVLDYQNLKSLLQPKFGKKLIIVNYSIDTLVPPGENFRSSIYKISAKIQRTKNSPVEDLHLVAKMIPKFVLEITKNVNMSDMFKKEINMYTDIIPLYSKIESESDIDEEENIVHFIPKLCGYRMPTISKTGKADKDAVILLENLKEQGYHVEDKKVGLNLEHAIKAIKVLARFHALGIAANHRYHMDFELIKSAYPKPDYNYHMADTMSDKFLDLIKSNPSFSKYVNPVEKIVRKQKGGWKADKVTSQLWSTIIHYDFWINNILFRDNTNGKLNDINIIDFQTYCYADIFLDLTYFLFTSLNDEVKMFHFDELLNIYYKTFIISLQKLHIDTTAYSKLKFDERFKEVASYEFIHCVLALHFFTADADGNKDKEENFMASLSTLKNTELYTKKIRQLMEIFEAKQWFA